MIHLDTNYLILAGRAGSPQAAQYNAWLAAGERFGTSVMAWAEFQCGPATLVEVRTAVYMVGTPEPILPADAASAADLFNLSGRRRGSLADCLIAAVALRLGSAVATDNRADFSSFPAVRLVPRPARPAQPHRRPPPLHADRPPPASPPTAPGRCLSGWRGPGLGRRRWH